MLKHIVFFLPFWEDSGFGERKKTAKGEKINTKTAFTKYTLTSDLVYIVETCKTDFQGCISHHLNSIPKECNVYRTLFVTTFCPEGVV